MDDGASNVHCGEIYREAERLIDALEMILDELLISAAECPELSAKRQQLKDIASIVDAWQNKGMTVPAQFLELKTALEGEMVASEDAIRVLKHIRNSLDALYKKTNSCIAQRLEKPPTRGFKKRSKHPRGSKTPQEAYAPVIIQALKAKNGKADVGFVRNWIETNMGHQFTPRDRERLQDGIGEYVWWNTAMWARFKMVQSGILKSDSPKGIWELNG